MALSRTVIMAPLLCFVLVSIMMINVASVAVDAKQLTPATMASNFTKEIMRKSKAAEMAAFMDATIDPCKDFYQFACGNWHRINPAQIVTNIMTDTFQTLQKAFDRKLKKMLYAASRRTNDTVENVVKDFFRSCEAMRRDRAAFNAELRDVLKEFGAMPAMMRGDGDGDGDGGDGGDGGGGGGDKTWSPVNFTWWELVATIRHKYNVDIIVSVSVSSDFERNTQNSVYLETGIETSQAGTRLLNMLQVTRTAMDLEEKLGVAPKTARRIAKEMSKFEQDLMGGSGHGPRADASFKELIANLTIDELQSQAGDVLDVKRFFAIILGGYVPSYVYVFDLDFWQNLVALMARTPKHIVANYILWQYLQEFFIDFHEAEDACLEKTKQHFEGFVEHLVYGEYRTPALESDVYAMWHEIRQTFRDRLQGDKLDWIQKATREYAIEKLDHMNLTINSYATRDFADDYKDLRLRRHTYFDNVRAMMALQARQSLAKINVSTTVAADGISYAPYYNILDNTIKIPVSLLQPLYLWGEHYPRALKYATLGYLIAHEVVHGFDDDGRKHDKDGNYREWWDRRSTYEFESRRKCFQAQYHNYRYGGQRLPDSVSQAENIADNAGVQLAYEAYMKWWQRHRHDDGPTAALEHLDGLPYNNQQLFFIAMAQVWCDDVQFLFKTSLVEADTHSPSRYRVIGSLSNFQEFSWVFKCQPDAPMDPEFKCAIY